MKKQLNIKKLILLNLPYILMGLFSTNFGEAWRMAVGADASAKMLSFFSTLPVALASWWPSLHPLDLLVGLCYCGGLRLAVYLKSKNAKKYRHGMEYGSARWGTEADIKPFVDPKFENNVILTGTEFLTMNTRPKIPANAHNADKPIQRGKAGGKAGKGRADGLAQPQQLFPEACASGQTVRRADFQAKPADEQVRDIRKNILPDFICRHAPPPLSIPAGAVFSPVPPPAEAAPGSASAGTWPVSAPNGNTQQSSL